MMVDMVIIVTILISLVFLMTNLLFSINKELRFRWFLTIAISLFCFLLPTFSIGDTVSGMSKMLFLSLPKEMQHYDVEIHKKNSPLEFFAPNFYTDRGLYHVNRKFCTVAGCHTTRGLFCLGGGSPKISGLRISDHQFFDASDFSASLVTVLANTSHEYSFVTDRYGIVGKPYRVHHVVRSVKLFRVGRRSFNKTISIKMNFPLLSSDIHIYSHYQFRSKSCLVKKLPQLHHG